jgi:ABC-type dipeptide/oligopeptide/nickel transport system permease component
MIIESVFDIPGVGGLYLLSITVLDYDFFMLLSGFYTLVGLAAGIIIDISYGFIDPRIRMGAK